MIDRHKKKSRKDRIMEAALRIFAEKGYQNTTITEISKEAGVSEATIYEYFGTKEDLLFAIPEKISNEGYEEMGRFLPYIKGVEGRLRAMLLGYINLYHTNPHYSALVLLQLTSNKRFRETAAHAAIRRSAHDMLLCIREGIADGTFKKDANAYLIRSMLLGTIEHLFIHWHMAGRPERSPSILDLLDSFMELIFDGVRAKKEETGLTLRLNLEDTRLLGEILQAQGILENEHGKGLDQGNSKNKTDQPKQSKKGGSP